MTFPGSLTDQIMDDFYMYYTQAGEEVLDFKWCGLTIVVTLPYANNKGSIEIYKDNEDVTLNVFPNKGMGDTIPATAHNFFGIITLLYKKARKKKED